MNKPDLSNWRGVKTYLESLTKTNIEFGKLMFECESYPELFHMKRILNKEAEQWGYPLYFKVVEKELYFYRKDV